MTRAARLSVRLYRRVARLFPEEFRARHSRPLLETSEDLIRDVASRHGLRGLAPVMVRILADLVLRVAIEHLDDFRRDAAHAVRVLRASPGFSIAAILSIALGLGVSIGAFSQIHSMVLAPLSGVVRPESLLTAPGVSHPVFEAVREDGAFGEVAAFTSSPVGWQDADGASRRIWGHAVTPDYFEVLGVQARLGRLLAEADDSRSVVVNARIWRQHLGSDPGVIGRQLRLNGEPLTVIGVAEPGFEGTTPLTAPADVWLPAASDTLFAPRSSAEVRIDPEARRFTLVGRLAPGVSQAEAESRIGSIARRFRPADRLDDPGERGRQVMLLNGGRRMPMRDADLPMILGVTGALVFLMLGIAAANVGALLLARAAARRPEVAIRLGLGASRLRILRQFLTEGLVLALAAGVVGYGFGWGYKAIIDYAGRVIGQSYVMVIEPLPMGFGMFALSLGLSLACGLMFGIAPAFHAVRSSMAVSMRPGAPASSGRFRWWSTRNLLVLQQVAGSLALLLLTGFVVLGVARTSGSGAPFDSRNVYMMSLDPIRDGLPGEQAVGLLNDLPEWVEGLPGVESAALASNPPVGLRSAAVQSMAGAGEAEAGMMFRRVQTERVGSGFVETLGLPVLLGESFGPADGENRTAPRVLVNETLARQSWPDRTPIGQMLELDQRRYQVAGVLPDLAVSGFMARTPPTAFRLLTDEDLTAASSFGITLIVRSPGGDPADAIQRLLEARAPGVVAFNATTVEREMETAAYLSRINMYVYGGIGLFGLLLAAVGVSGITAYAVVQRRKEIAIRLALGASPARILGLVSREGAVLVLVGLVIGLGLAVAGARLMGASFTGLAEATGTTTTDPVLLVGAPLLLGLLTMAAAWLPARRSLEINPAAALKEE